MWNLLIGLRVVAIKEYVHDKRKKHVKLFGGEPPGYIFFDDKKTYIIFNSQDPYEYHDANGSARTGTVNQDEQGYANLISWDNLREVEDG